MDKFSHREAFHRHLANIYNEKEKREFASLCRFYDKCKDDKQFECSREEKELKQHLVTLKREQDQIAREGSCLTTLGSANDGGQHVQATELSQTATRERIPPSAHEVAVHMLHKDSLDHNDIKRKLRKNSLQAVQAKPSNVKQHSWHRHSPATNAQATFATALSPQTRFPVINGAVDRSRRRCSVADPQEASHILQRQGAWNNRALGVSHSSKTIVNKRDSATLVNKTTSKALASAAMQEALKLRRPKKGSYQDVVIRLPSGHTLAKKSSKTSAVPKAKRSNHEPICAGHDAHDIHTMRTTSMYYVVPEPQSAFPPSHTMTQHRHSIDETALQHYYELLARNESALKGQDISFETPKDSHGHAIAGRRKSHRQRVMALEALLRQLPSFKNKDPPLDPLACLNCRYLRLSKNNIEDLEKQCALNGQDPGIHANIPEDKLLEYFKDT